ncbi:MAG: helix-turn-helix domain-containing protein [Gemmatimonas sp.]|jgi:transcriptional regulator with XRE-family HTH domain
MRITSTSTTDEVLREIGGRLRDYRLQQNRTIDELARDAGVGTMTVKRTEAGERPTLASLVKLLRALGRLETLEACLPQPAVSPLQLSASRGRERQRARPPKGAPMGTSARTPADD